MDALSTHTVRQEKHRVTPATTLARVISAILSFEMLFALFLFAGRYKADPRFAWIPVDLTALFFGLSMVSGAFVLWRQRYKVRRTSIKITLAGVAFALYVATSLLWTPGRAYANQKTLYVATLALGPLVAAAWVIAFDRRRLRRLALWIVLISSWFALESTKVFIQSARNRRVTALGGSYLGLGRTIGLGALVLVVYVLFLARTRTKKLVGVALLGWFVFVLSVLGGRGPLLSTLAGALVPLLVGLRLSPSGRLAVRRYAVPVLVLLVIGFVIVGFLYLTDNLPITLVRVLQWFQPGGERNTVARLGWFGTAVTLWSQRPLLGHGIGAWPILLGLPDEPSYPHNMILEILAELGLLGLALFGLLLFVALRTLGSLTCIRSDPWRLLVLMFFLNAFVNAMSTGDIADNRIVFCVLGLMALARTDSQPPILWSGQAREKNG